MVQRVTLAQLDLKVQPVHEATLVPKVKKENKEKLVLLASKERLVFRVLEVKLELVEKQVYKEKLVFLVLLVNRV